MMLRISSIVSSLSVLFVVACGGGATPAAEAPATEPAPKTEAAETSKPKEEAPAPTAPSNLAKDVILHVGTAFLLNHQKSDIGIAATAACEKQSKGDVAKKANCTSKAINKMKREGFMLEEDKSAGSDDDESGNGKWIFVRFNIDGKGIKIETNRVPVDVASASGKNLTLKTSGPDKAARKQGSVPSELAFEVPDEYTVILQEAARGKLVFEPKMGLFAKE